MNRILLTNFARLHLAFLLLMALHLVTAVDCQAQNASSPNPPITIEADDIQGLLDESPEKVAKPEQPTSIDLLTLILRGGAFMIPIGIMSLMVVTLAVERMIHLRKECLLPRNLERELTLLNSPPETFNPSAALKSCKNHPSASSRIIQSMLVRTGQSLHEIEHAGLETAQREIDKCSSSIRWLTLAGAATPLMGLLGTVWGMIMAFHESSTLTPDRSRSEQLSEGIYTALTTTLAGLAVAIPAAILALYLENRLLKIFHSVEEFALDLSPGLTRFIGRGELNSTGQLTTMRSQSPNTVTPPPNEQQAATSQAITEGSH